MNTNEKRERRKGMSDQNRKSIMHMSSREQGKRAMNGGQHRKTNKKAKTI